MSEQYVHDAVSGVRTRDVELWNGGSLPLSAEHRALTQVQVLESQQLLYGYGAIRNAAAVPIREAISLGGATSRNLFREMLAAPVDRGGVPNWLWCVVSLALIASGIWVIL